MFNLVATIHIIVTVILILLVLVQDSKGGAGMFAGGSSQSILGATGGATLLAKLTRVMAITFALTCIMLTIYTARRGESVTEGVAAPAIPSQPTSPMEMAPAAETPKAETAPKK